VIARHLRAVQGLFLVWATGMNNVKTPLLLHQQDLKGIVLDYFAIAIVEINQLF